MPRRDEDDVHLLALAITLKIPIWSNDRHFADLPIRRYTTAQLLRPVYFNLGPLTFHLFLTRGAACARRSPMKKFTPDMLIYDALGMHERAAEVFLSFGLPCHNCAVAEVETIEQGARSKGMDPGNILAKLNSLFEPGASPNAGQAQSSDAQT